MKRRSLPVPVLVRAAAEQTKVPEMHEEKHQKIDAVLSLKVEDRLRHPASQSPSDRGGEFTQPSLLSTFQLCTVLLVPRIAAADL